MNSDVRSRLPRPRALAAMAAVTIAGACTYDFAQFEGLAPPDLEDGGSGRGGGVGRDASAPDGSAGKAGSAGSGNNDAASTGGTGGSGGTTGGTGGSGGSGGSSTTGGSGGSGGTAGKGGAAGSAGSSGSGGTAGKADASTDTTGGTGGAAGGTGGATGGTGGATGGTGGATGGTGGATGGTGGATGGTSGSGGTGGATGGTAGSSGAAGSSNPDASDVVSSPDANADRREADVVPDATFDCASVSGKTYQGHCYYARSVAVDWNTASTTTCEAPAHLVTITSAGEQEVVASLLPTQDRWIGMRRPVNSPTTEASFYWVTNEPLSYRNWDVYSDADKEPNYTGECVRMRFTSKWADVVCTEALAAICERE